MNSGIIYCRIWNDFLLRENYRANFDTKGWHRLLQSPWYAFSLMSSLQKATFLQSPRITWFLWLLNLLALLYAVVFLGDWLREEGMGRGTNGTFLQPHSVCPQQNWVPHRTHSMEIKQGCHISSPPFQLLPGAVTEYPSVSRSLTVSPLTYTVLAVHLIL